MPFERAGQVCHHHNGTLENPHKEHVFAFVIFVDARRQLGNFRINLFPCEEYVLQIVLHVLSLHGFFFLAGASSRRTHPEVAPQGGYIFLVRFKYYLNPTG